MNNKYLILIILLVVLVILSISFNIYEYQNNNNLKKEINTLAQGRNQLIGQITISNQGKEQLTEQVAELKSRINDLGDKIRGYLKAEGEITVSGNNCDEAFEFCLEELTKKLVGTSGIDCSIIPDGSCPLWCAAGSDIDCCRNKPGYEWIQGRGCYDVSGI
ncbi:MAG: hypothetical protein ABH805_01490 [Candidatus Nealsonbacteria bacterium]